MSVLVDINHRWIVAPLTIQPSNISRITSRYLFYSPRIKFPKTLSGTDMEVFDQVAIRKLSPEKINKNVMIKSNDNNRY